MEKFIIGFALGGLGGALLATNNCKMRALVKKGQEEIKCRLDEILDEKLAEMKTSPVCETVQNHAGTVKETVEDGVAAVKETVKKAKRKKDQ